MIVGYLPGSYKTGHPRPYHVKVLMQNKRARSKSGLKNRVLANRTWRRPPHLRGQSFRQKRSHLRGQCNRSDSWRVMRSGPSQGECLG